MRWKMYICCSTQRRLIRSTVGSYQFVRVTKFHLLSVDYLQPLKLLQILFISHYYSSHRITSHYYSYHITSLFIYRPITKIFKSFHTFCIRVLTTTVKLQQHQINATSQIRNLSWPYKSCYWPLESRYLQEKIFLIR